MAGATSIICLWQSSSCSSLNSACNSTIDAVVTFHGYSARLVVFLALFGTESFSVNTFIASDIGEVTSCCRVFVARRVKVEAAWVEDIDIDITSWAGPAF
jgi:hypothetical protein